jgi:hypothetical protein
MLEGCRKGRNDPSRNVQGAEETSNDLEQYHEHHDGARSATSCWKGVALEEMIQAGKPGAQRTKLELLLHCYCVRNANK